MTLKSRSFDDRFPNAAKARSAQNDPAAKLPLTFDTAEKIIAGARQVLVKELDAGNEGDAALAKTLSAGIESIFEYDSAAGKMPLKTNGDVCAKLAADKAEKIKLAGTKPEDARAAKITQLAYEGAEQALALAKKSQHSGVRTL